MSRHSITIPDAEDPIISAYAAAKGKKSMTDLFLFAVEHLMSRSKVKNLYEQLIDVRIEKSRKAHKTIEDNTEGADQPSD